MAFDPIRKREVFFEFLLQFMRDQKYDPTSLVGWPAQSDVHSIFQMNLAGLGQYAPEFLTRAIDWIDDALRRGEKPADEPINFYCSSILPSKALALWMRDGVNAVDVWAQAVDYHQKASREDSWHKKDLPTWYLDEHMPMCWQAEAYDAGIAEYEHYHGAKTISLKGVPKQRDYGYALCLQAKDKRFDPELLHAAGVRMMTSKMNKQWLSYAEWDAAMMWLKIIFWHRDPSLMPEQVILMAYDVMPDVERPFWAK